MQEADFKEQQQHLTLNYQTDKGTQTAEEWKLTRTHSRTSTHKHTSYLITLHLPRT